jgi:hypothetical protein
LQFKFKMIGFSQDFQNFRRRDEGMGTESIHKGKLYKLIADEYLLPPIASKGVDRDYLLKVREGEVFRISNREYKQFEYGLERKTQQSKVGIVNNALLVKKLNLLLRSKGERELGFTEYNLPEQCWLYKIARYIDRSNLLEFFEAPALGEPPLHQDSNIISKVYYGRLYASQWLFRIEAAKKNKKLWEAFEKLSERYRTLASMKVNADVLDYEIRESRRRIAMLETDLHDMVGKISFTYTGLEDPTITPELVIAGGDGLTPEKRQQLSMNAQL